MSTILEKAQERVAEVRTKGVLATIKELRGGSSGGSSGSPQAPTIKEIREKGVLAVLEEKFPKVKEIRGGGGGSAQLPTIKEVREKGVLAVLGEKFPKVKEFREKGLLARIGGSPEIVKPGELIQQEAEKVKPPPGVGKHY